jgi:superfamily II DNA or RNA helicase
MRDRWNVFEEWPLTNASELCYTLRRVVNSDKSRKEAVLDIFTKHPRCIIFYNFDYELDILRELDYSAALGGPDVIVAEWNGHKHQEIPESSFWVYLVQYTAGCEGWNCIKTDTIVFFSQNYSYKVLEQASGRIDRLNTAFLDLWYFHLISKAPIDISIRRALDRKQKFNERKFVEW